VASARTIIAGVLAVVLVGVGAFSVGRLTSGVEATPSSTSAAAGFARDMQVHHDQGVELAFLIRDRTDDPELRSLAYDIAITQANQSGQMLGWLNVWNLPQSSPEPSMTWMSRPPLTGATDHHGEPGTAHAAGEAMPGLATPEQMQSLRDADGVAAEKIFLTLMIAHHQGAIEMGDAVLTRTDVSVVRSFATGMIVAQESEIGYMKELLAER
jgi:uncharacterized protein (DUF305 family)